MYEYHRILKEKAIYNAKKSMLQNPDCQNSKNQKFRNPKLKISNVEIPNLTLTFLHDHQIISKNKKHCGGRMRTTFFILDFDIQDSDFRDFVMWDFKRHRF